MALTAAKLQVEVTADTNNAEKGLKGIGQRVDEAKGKLPGFLGMFAGFAGATALTNVAGQAFSFLSGQVTDMIAAGEQANQMQAQTEAVLRSTSGAAGVTTKAVDDLATAMLNKTGIDDDATQAAENMLLTFTNIHSNVFPATTKAVADMATAMNGGAIPSQQQLTDTAIQVGKALQDPINGVTALQRVGVKLSATQQQQVKDFMAAGNAAGAQKVILGELNKEFGGSAEAAGKANGGIAIMTAQLDNAKQTIGQQLIPIVAQLAQATLPPLTAVLGKVSDAIAFVSQHGDQLKPVAIALGAVLGVIVVGALAAATIAAWSFTAALLANPITWIAIGIVAAIAGIVFAVTHWGQITTWLRNVVGTVFADIGAFFGVLGTRIGQFVGGVVSWFQQLPGKIYQAGVDMIQGFINGIKSLAGNVANALAGVIHGALSILPGGSAMAHLFGIPGFASGGITPGGPVIVGEAGPELLIPSGGSRVVPLAGRGGGSGGGSVTQHISLILDGEVIARAAVKNMPNVVRLGTGNRSW
jgi:hypothetical protein